MADEASFTRVDTDLGAEFRVIPAPVVGGIAFLTGGGCVVALATLTIFFVGLALLYALLINGVGPFLTVAFFTAPFWIPAAFVLRRRRRQFHIDAGPRDPVTLIVNAEGITAGGKHYPKGDIAELFCRHPQDHDGYKDQSITISDNASYNIGRSAGMKRALAAANTSFALMIRMKSSSAIDTLVSGLTPAVGKALNDDVVRALG